MQDRLPAIYSKALAAWPDWSIKIPQLGDRSWNLASAGSGNSLQLDTRLKIDGNAVAFIDQMRIWFDVSQRFKNTKSKSLERRFAECLAIGEDNGDLLLIGPDGDSLHVFHHDGMTVDQVFDSVSDLIAIMSQSSQSSRRSTETVSLPKPFIRRWKNLDDSLGDEFLTLAADGSVVRQFDDGSSHVGTWTVKNDMLHLNAGEPECPPDLETYEVESISDSQMVLFDRENDFRERFARCD